MNAPPRLGGMMGFGRIAYEPDEPWFHAEWERRAFGLTLAVAATGAWNLDMTRHARESLHPAEYLSSSYYEIWTKGLEKLLVRQGLVGEDELKAGQAPAPPAPRRPGVHARPGAPRAPVGRVLKADEVAPALAKGGPTDRPAELPARFAAGDEVVTRIMHPT